MTQNKTKARSAGITPASDDYLALVRKFPLRPLRSKPELEAAGKLLDTYIGRSDLSPGVRDYIEALSYFVEAFERQQTSAAFKRLKPIDLLRHLMEENEMSVTDLGYILGSRGLASEVLNGHRGLSKTLIRKLSAKFGLDPALFLDAA
jgi:HTH-type transcriptional regulator/antitoxin HigA